MGGGLFHLLWAAMKRISVDAKTFTCAKKLGDGDAMKGVREAVRLVSSMQRPFAKSWLTEASGKKTRYTCEVCKKPIRVGQAMVLDQHESYPIAHARCPRRSRKRT